MRGPDQFAGRQVEAIDLADRADRKHQSAINCGSRAGTVVVLHFTVANPVRMRPNRRAILARKTDNAFGRFRFRKPIHGDRPAAGRDDTRMATTDCLFPDLLESLLGPATSDPWRAPGAITPRPAPSRPGLTVLCSLWSGFRILRPTGGARRETDEQPEREPEN